MFIFGTHIPGVKHFQMTSSLLNTLALSLWFHMTLLGVIGEGCVWVLVGFRDGSRHVGFGSAC